MKSLFHRFSRLPVFAVTVLLLVAQLPLSLQAQPKLYTQFLDLQWPTVRLTVDVECADGSRVTVPDPAAWHVTDRGNPVGQLSVSCPDTGLRMATSVSLVFDASGSMAGANNSATKLGAHAFIDQMDGINDETAVIWFTQVITVYQQMTTIKPMLHSAVDALPASGATALWDGIYAGIIELINNGVNQSRAVVVVADGQDNSSRRTVAEIIDLARRHRVAVYLIGIGPAIQLVEMEQIAKLTGGRFYQAQPSQVPTFFEQIFPLISQSRRCILQYDIIGPGCPDGLQHEVAVTVDPVCQGGSATDTVLYMAPLDSTMNTQVDIGLGDVTVKAANQYLLPLELRTPLARTVMPGLSFHLELGASCFDGSVGFPGAPPEFYFGKPAIVTPEGSGVRITLPDTFTVEGAGVILNLGLRAPFSEADTTCCDAMISDITFDGPCYVARPHNGRVCVVGRQPAVTCSMSALPRISWKTELDDYFPNPFPVTMEIMNAGDAPADSLHFRIDYDRSAFTIATPIGEVVPGSPLVLDTGATQSVTWQLRAKPRETGDTLRLCITATFNNHKDVMCCVDVYIPPRAKPALEVVCADRITLVYDATADAWVPNPFAPGFLVKNVGDKPAMGVTAEVLLPPGLVLELGQPATKTVAGGTLPPWNPGDPVPVVDWTCRWVPRLCSDTLVTMTVRVSGQDEGGLPLDPVSCTSEIFIQAPVPPSSIPITPPGIIDVCVGDSVTLDAGAGFSSYLWNTNERTRRIIVWKPGDYHCVVGFGPDCQAFTDTVTVVKRPLPPEPVIARQLDTLVAPDGAAWLWTRNGAILPGDTLQKLPLSETGLYRVRVTTIYGCTAWSAPYPVDVLDVPEHEAAVTDAVIQAFHSWPNPASGVLTVEVRLGAASASELSLHDLLGREVWRARRTGKDSGFTQRIDVSALRPGLYLMRLRAAGESRSRMVLLR